MRLKYTSDADVMYLAIGDNVYPNSFQKISRIDNWNAQRNARWTIDVPYSYSETILLEHNTVPMAFTVAGDFVFIDFFGKSPVTGKNGEICIYDAITGQFVQAITPGSEVFGESGWSGSMYDLNAMKRSDGKYLTAIEDEWKGKVILYTIDLPSAPMVEKPSIAPLGGEFNDSVALVMTTATAGAEIRYTLNGAEPGQTSPLYSDAIILHSSAKVKAKGFKDGMTPSSVAEAAFQIVSTTVVANPTVSPPGGVYDDTVIVTITCPTAGAAIHFTVDGSEPMQTSPVYESPLKISDTVTIRVRAFKEPMSPSGIIEAHFTIPGDKYTGVQRTFRQGITNGAASSEGSQCTWRLFAANGAGIGLVRGSNARNYLAENHFTIPGVFILEARSKGTIKKYKRMLLQK
jgi:hypothetical protein